MKRWLKTLFVFVAILLLPTLWLLISHIHAKCALERYKAQLRAAGEKLTIDELIPPHIPPEKNGAKLFDRASNYLRYVSLIDTNPPLAMKMVAPGKAMIGWQQPYSVSVYETFTNSWKDVEQDLKQRAPELEILHRATAFPELDFDVDYHNLFHDSSPSFTHIQTMKQAAVLLSLAVVFDLHRGETGSSVTNLHTLLALLNAWKDEPTPVSQSVRNGAAFTAFTAQWELLHATNLKDRELAVLDRDWESMKFVQPMAHTLEMDRAWEILAMQYVRTSNSPSGRESFSSSIQNSRNVRDVVQAVAGKTSDTLWRAKWSYDDELRVLQGEQVVIESARQIVTNGFFRDALAEQDHKIKMLGLNNGNTDLLRRRLIDQLMNLARDSTEGSQHELERTMYVEASRRMAIVAIALKRYQLLHGHWPANLKTLVPDFLSAVPRDPMDGLPLRYRTNADGAFTLYCIGSDDHDNGGDPTPVNPRDTSYSWLTGHDWVWPQPATEQEIQNYKTPRPPIE